MRRDGVVGAEQHIAAVDQDKSFHTPGPSLVFPQGLQRRRVESQPRMTPILTLENVSKIYPMGELEVRALDEVDLQVYRGELLMVLGQSGSGKSTLLNIIGGMDRPTRGKVTYHDDTGKTLSLDKASDTQLTRFRRTYVGFVFQFFNLIPTLTALENVQVATALNDRPGPFNAKSSLEVVGLGQRGDHFPSQLSGGQQQRVAIARALASNPELLLCDEPTGNLDSETGEQVLNLLTQVHTEYGKTVIMITHNPESMRIADRVIELRDGKIESTTVPGS
jgi:putative ABC transport system ATP-binding protein